MIDEVFANIVMRYNVKSNETDIKKDIKIYIKDKEVLWRFSNTTNYTNNIFTIADEFVQKYSDILIEKNADRAPYDHLREYEQYFKDIITDKTILDKNIVHIRKGKGLEWDKSYVFAPSNDRWIYFNIQLQCIQNGTKSTLVEEKTISVEGKTEMDIRRYLWERIDVVSHCIKDWYLYVKTWKDTIYSYIEITSGNEDNKKTIDPTIIAYDYFYQNRPIIPEVYKRFGAIYRDKSKNYNRENDNTYRWKKDTIKKLIIRDMLETWTLDKLPIDNDKLIFLYLQWFVKRNADALQKEWISINPYADYQTQYAEALENTWTTQDKAVPEKITYEEREKYDFHYAGKFYTQTGDEYDVAEVTIAGVKYLYARNIAEDNNTYHTAEWWDIKVLNYYFSRGKEVAKKYNKSQKISDEASDAIAKNINIQTNKLINSIHNKKPDSRSKGFNPWLVKR